MLSGQHGPELPFLIPPTVFAPITKTSGSINPSCPTPPTYGLGNSHIYRRKEPTVEKTPKDVSNTEKLMRYWAHGPGAAKIGWTVAPGSGDYSRCVVLLGKYVPDHMVKGLCANLHKRATGRWPNENK